MAETVQNAPTEKPRKARGRYTPKDDVTQEDYQGSGAVVSGLGYTALLHWVTNIVFVGGLVTLALFNHDAAGNSIKWIKTTGEALAKEDRGFISRKCGGFISWLFGKPAGSFAHLNQELAKLGNTNVDLAKAVEEAAQSNERGFLQNIAHHLVKPFIKAQKGGIHAVDAAATAASQDAIKQAVKDAEKVENTLVAGGVGLIMSTIVSTVAGFMHGGAKSHHGRAQFDRAKNEIHTLRDQYDELRQKYVETKTELDTRSPGQGDGRDEPTLQTNAPTPINGVNEETPKIRDDKKPGTVVNAMLREVAITPQQSNAVAT
jgi:hypothetical protein